MAALRSVVVRTTTAAACGARAATTAVVPAVTAVGGRRFMSEQHHRPEPSMADRLDALGTRRIFTEEHDMMREMARKFFQERIAPHHDAWEKEGMVSRDAWTEAGELGLLGITIPEEYGGPGADVQSAAVMWEEQAYAGLFGPGYAIHSDIVLPYIHHYGTEEQKQKYLPDACAGKCITAIAMTEPGAGSDLQGVSTTAIKDGDEWVLNGSKVFISNGQLSDAVVVVAKTDLEAKRAAHGLSLFIVDAGTPGFSKGKNLHKMGLKAQDTSELFFEDCRVPESALLGQLNKGFYHLMTELPQERLLLGVMAVAHAEACYEWTREYINERKAFSGTLANLQTVRHKMAELKTDIAVCRAFADQCILLHSEGRLNTEMASMVKYWCTDLESRVADACVQLHGGYGYMWEYPVCRAYVDARVQRIYGGANEIMKELISRSV
ncbi:long-chain specific acyl-CoA dehydrogenase [Salpingoeca rosetta]|uniref:Long-chain specific acyl-CoA dehydrogenase n=1 Tax=Salpingoeca rosetta (strain ATCC 50818 / BSB-021) TaxID=946362 RepID=F2U2I6_SALR5|nr:long-chain specific acyl-CoA dehydrogenase [Salpingoeca rosetta]EGD81838.1 long-chain specific acyl-CoA dehydrogenase [Salpingoeca rosetta]|eukprot:XP_004997042.1 long-chain specific acyl-CoA dehydrogenase [Salpingoeca rosetta]